MRDQWVAFGGHRQPFAVQERPALDLLGQRQFVLARATPSATSASTSGRINLLDAGGQASHWPIHLAGIPLSPRAAVLAQSSRGRASIGVRVQNMSLDHVEHIRPEASLLRAALASADPAAAVPSCPGWHADDLLLHLGVVLGFWAAVVEGRLTAPPAAEQPCGVPELGTRH